MAVRKVTEIRRLVLRELAAYRHTCAEIRGGATVGRDARAWMRIIERVRLALKEEEPEKARFMTRMFGLDHPIPQRKTARQRLLTLSRELNCSEATLYNWRAEIVELVIIGGAEAGLIRVFRDGKGGRRREKTV